MLKTRVLTALVLIPLFLGALFALPDAGWMIFCAVLMAAAAAEWRQLAGLSGAVGGGFVLLTVALFAAALQLPRAGLLGVFTVSALFWLGVIPCWLRGKWRLPRAPWAGCLLGWGFLLPAGLAMVALRGDGWLLLAVMAVAWVADTFAYFAGRLFGRHKLAPSISPGKTWEGVAGALLAVAAYCWLLPKPFAFFPAADWASQPLPQQLLWVLAGVVLLIVSVQGDLIESLFKRQVGIKDSGRLLPGHGGVLDRVDSLLAVLPVAAALHFLHLSFFALALAR